jgi:hypothetical protein
MAVEERVRPRLGARAAVLCAASLLAACQTTPPAPLSQAHYAFFKALRVAKLPAPRPSYQEVQGCSYRSVTTDAEGRYRDSHLDVSLRPVRDRFLVRVAESRSTSTALIGSDGKMFDFNLAGYGQPANAETFGALARQRAAALKPVHGAESHVFNELALFFPHYPAAAMVPGEGVAVIADEGGRPWARYVYRGTATFEGREVLVLDLMRRSETKPKLGERTIGFSLVDRKQALPLFLIVESIGKIDLRQLRCR